MLTINGRVRLLRRRWHSSGEGTSTPLDAWLDAAEATISVGVRELACLLNSGGSNFDRAAANLARAAQVTLSGETLRQVVEAEGRQVLRAQQAGTVPVGWTAADCVTPTDDKTAPGPTRVYLGSDGVQVPLVTSAEKKARRQKVKAQRRQRGKKARPLPPARPGAEQAYQEFKLVVYYDETQTHRLVAGTKGNHEVAGRLMRHQAARIHLDQADEKVGNVDGAPWIRNQVERQNLPLDALGLDFYHLAENVHKARRAVYGEENAAGQEWVGPILHTFKHEGYDAAWEQLLTWRRQWRSRTKRQAIDQLLGYVSERRDMIRYAEFQKRGWQIGSGPTEGQCKTLSARLKGSGMRWDAANAEAVMALEALHQSGQWQGYWPSQLRQAG